MNAKKIVLIAMGVPALLLLLLLLLVVAAIRGTAAGTGIDGLSVSCGAPAEPMVASDRAYDAEQVRNAQIIKAVAAGRALPARAGVIAIATAMRESDLRNIGYGDRDSLGLFQQRPGQGWGTPEEIMDPVHATGSFLDRLVRVPGWQTLELTVAAQAVQHSALPGAYQEFEAAAQQMSDAFGSACSLAGAPAVPGHTALDPARYPWSGDMADCDNDGHGYCAAECVSFAAWAVRNDGLPHTSPDFLGNAYQWHAPRSSRTPAVGDVASGTPTSSAPAPTATWRTWQPCALMARCCYGSTTGPAATTSTPAGSPSPSPAATCTSRRPEAPGRDASARRCITSPDR